MGVLLTAQLEIVWSRPVRPVTAAPAVGTQVYGSVSASRAASPHSAARGQKCASATLGDEAITTEKLKMANQLNVRVLWRMSLKPSGFRLRGECAPSDTGMLWRRSGLSSWFKKLSSAVVGSIHSPADRIHLKLIR